MSKNQADAWFLSLSLAKPRAVAAAGWGVSMIAGGLVGMAAIMQGLSPWFAVLMSLLPFVIHGIVEWRQAGRLDELRLEVSPQDGWFLKHASRTFPVSLEWGSQHFLGLTLSLKNTHHPHHKGTNRTFTVWKSAVDARDYRRLCVMYTWFIRQPSSCNPRETQ